MASPARLTLLLVLSLKVQAAHSQLVYLLDPVLGDGGRLYVDKAISEMMRDRLLPLADIITPNQFELGLLADTAITGETDAIAAARTLLGGRLQTVFVTGVSTTAGQIADIMVRADTEMLIPADKQASGVSGSGDVLSAFFLSAVVSGLSPEPGRRDGQPEQRKSCVAPKPS